MVRIASEAAKVPASFRSGMKPRKESRSVWRDAVQEVFDLLLLLGAVLVLWTGAAASVYFLTWLTMWLFGI